jgi:hypothetical protein
MRIGLIHSFEVLGELPLEIQLVLTLSRHLFHILLAVLKLLLRKRLALIRLLVPFLVYFKLFVIWFKPLLILHLCRLCGHKLRFKITWPEICLTN